MSPGRFGNLFAVLLTCTLLTIAASAARAQTGGSGWVPTRVAVAPIETVSSPSHSIDLGSFHLGMPLQQGASLMAYRWFEPMLGSRLAQGARYAPRDAVVSAWWRKRR